MADTPTSTAAELRRFTRNFTQATGLLRGRLYDVDLSLTEARVLYEIAQENGCQAEHVRARLGLDKGYLSRTIARLESRGWVVRAVDPGDRRARVLTLTAEGQALFARIDQRSSVEMERLVAHLDASGRAQLTDALRLVERLLAPDRSGEVTLRNHRIGDLGHVISRHGVLYAQEYGWDGTFEGAVAEIAAGFLQKHDPERECCLIAEVGGVPAGSATVVRIDGETAKLRIVYVEPWARGRGIGARLVTACMSFARSAGYIRMKLWTNDVLLPARSMYERLGFACIERTPHVSFGVHLVGEIWERELVGPEDGQGPVKVA